MLRTSCLSALMACSVMLAAAASHASVKDRAIDAARQCTKHFSKNERIQGIPTHLLAAIAATESGRWNKTLGMALPWPWTINAEGKGFYLNSKAEAIRKVKQLQSQGIKSIDVGCMQVNLKHHPRAFANLAQAFDPKYNVAYAAKFLRSNYNEKKSWTKATAAYHSRTKKYGDKYLSRIENVWSKIVGRVRKARAKRGIEGGERRINVAERMARQSESSMADDFASEVIAPEGSDVDKLSALAPAAGGKKALPRSTQPTMRVIELSNKRASQRTNVMVIRPTSHITKEETIDAPVKLEASRSNHSAPRDLFVMDYQENRRAPKSVTSGHDSFKNSDSGATMPHFVFVD
ncbi:MAG: lytic transglycosylase domain-containing protein [Rickettsiales bacterium]|nr:lytic transglycosylase domain-containing protein [Rickettsiales bacterium]